MVSMIEGASLHEQKSYITSMVAESSEQIQNKRTNCHEILKRFQVKTCLEIKAMQFKIGQPTSLIRTIIWTSRRWPRLRT